LSKINTAIIWRKNVTRFAKANLTFPLARAQWCMAFNINEILSSVHIGFWIEAKYLLIVSTFSHYGSCTR
jgi:hypothetical protein